MGDHIVITTPGKYTIERDIHHSYQVGVIILSSSVILSGNDHIISPSSPEKETVGIWIAAYDLQGIPITDVTLKDIQIEGETYGIFIEGDELTPLSWANESKDPAKSTRQDLLTQMIELLSITISACTTAIGISDGIGVQISDVELYENEYGITASGRDLEIKDSTITNNSKVGIFLDGVIETLLSQNIITKNTIGIEMRGSSIDTLVETDNTYENQQNILTDKPVSLPSSLSNLSLASSLPQISTTTSINEEPASSEEIDPVPTEPQATVAVTPEISPTTPSQSLFPTSPETSFLPLPLTPSLTQPPTQFQTPSPTRQKPTSDHPKNFITGTHASIIGDTIPDTLTPGSRTFVSLTVANTGSATWRQDDGIGISAVGETSMYAPAWQLVPIQANNKGGEYALEFSLLSPATPGEYTFSFQAGKRRSELTSTFGRPYTKTVLVR